jgi:DNA-binding GntR family transcriptional regulator
MLNAIERESLAVEVANRIQEEIFEGNFLSGQKLLEQELSMRMKTSRGPIRDALIILEHRGLIVREFNHGATVVTMTAKDVQEIASIRLSLEELAYKYVIKNACEADIAQLQDDIAQFRACLKGNYSDLTAVDLDLKFHEDMVEASQHNRVAGMWQSIKTQIRFLILKRNAFSIYEFERAADDHEKILSRIQNKDEEGGMIILQKHDAKAYRKLIESYAS